MTDVWGKILRSRRTEILLEHFSSSQLIVLAFAWEVICKHMIITGGFVWFVALNYDVLCKCVVFCCDRCCILL